MKGKLTGLLSVALVGLSLSGCSAVLQDHYSSVTPHTVAHLSGDSSIILVESYHELVNALASYVNDGKEAGQIRLVDYDKDLAKTHLAEAVVEVKNETVMGSFSVEDIQWEMNSIVAYLECNITITYKTTKEDMDQIVAVKGSTSIVRALTQSMENMERELVLQNAWASSDRGQISNLVQQAYGAAAQYIVEIPEIHTTFYPKEGPWRIVELSFQYRLSEGVRKARQDELERAISEKTSTLWVHGNGDIYGEVIKILLEDGVLLVGDSTTWQVLVEYRGDSRGYALAFLALCQELGLSCQMVEGTRGEEVHYWNVISPANGVYHHVDVTQGFDQEGYPLESLSVGYFGREEMENQGYSWDRTLVPEAVSYLS